MDNLDNKKFLADLIDRAQSSEHTKFEYIRDRREYRSRKLNQRALKLLIAGLERSAESLFKKYCKSVERGTADVANLLARNVLLRTKGFYEMELAIVEDMIGEFDAYLLYGGNLLNIFLFQETRLSAECRDYRSFN